MRKYLALLLLVGLMALQPASAQSLVVDTPRNGSSLNGPLVLTGRATPGSTVEVRGGLTGTTFVGSDGRWSMVLDPQGRRNVNLLVVARGPWGVSDTERLSYVVNDSYAYNTNYYNRSVQDSLDDPYYDYLVSGDNRYYIEDDRYAQVEALQLSVNSPTNGASFRGNFVLEGTGTPGAEVVVTGNLQGTSVVSNNGHWRMPLSLGGLAPGTVVNLTAFARDRAGNQSRPTQLKYAVAW
jgi:hypothetical protein